MGTKRPHNNRNSSKSVRFAEELHTIATYLPLRSELSQDDFKLQWFDNEDFYHIRQQAMHTCRRRRCNPYQVSNINNSNSSSSNQFANCGDILHRSYHSTQNVLNLWTTHGNGRGLEGWANDIHGRNRKINRQGVRNVVEYQNQLKKKSNNNKEQQPETIAHNLCRVSSKLSQPARDFAARMGLADHQAVLEQEKQDNTTTTTTTTPSSSSRKLLVNIPAKWQRTNVPKPTQQREVEFIYI